MSKTVMFIILICIVVVIAIIASMMKSASVQEGTLEVEPENERLDGNEGSPVEEVTAEATATKAELIKRIEELEKEGEERSLTIQSLKAEIEEKESKLAESTEPEVCPEMVVVYDGDDEKRKGKKVCPHCEKLVAGRGKINFCPWCATALKWE